MLQRRTLLQGLAIGTLSLTACTGDEVEDPDGTKQPRRRMALITADQGPWSSRMGEGARRFADETGHKVEVRSPESATTEGQEKLVREAVEQKVDAILVDPIDAPALKPALAEAIKADITVISTDIASLEDATYAVEPFDQVAFGIFLMDALADAVNEKGSYSTMLGTADNPRWSTWLEAAVTHQKDRYPDMKLLKDIPQVESGGTLESAREAATNLFKKHPDLKGVLCASPSDAQAAGEAIGALNLRNRAVAVGTGLPSANRELLELGQVAALVFWDPAETAHALCTLAARVLGEATVEAPLDLNSTGYRSMALVEGTTKAFQGSGWQFATKDNVGDFDF